MKIMKRKIAAFLMFFAFVLGVFGICVGAEESVYTENIRAINEGVYTLNTAMDGYSQEDSSDGKQVAIRTNGVIVRYVNKINDLRADARVSGEDLSAEVALITFQGEVSGECAWIFESCGESLSEVARERAASVYEDTLAKIDESLSYEHLSEERNAHVRGVILAIYEEKIAALYSAEDSASVSGIGDEAIREMRELSSIDIGDYERVFERSANEIRVQRQRERAIARFSDAYDQINGAGSFETNKESDENISSFLYLAREADTVVGFNLAIERSLSSVLETRIGDLRGEYTRDLLSDITHRLSLLRSSADTSGEILDAGDAFEGISRRILLADKKDELVLYAKDAFGDELPERALELLDSYNREGGIFECCADDRLAEFSLKQAKLRVDWIVECERYILLSESFFEDRNEEIELRFDELYFTIDTEMAASLTLEGTRDILRGGRSQGELLCFEFEAEGYRFRFSDVIDAPIGDITCVDANALREAILEYDSLSSSAKALVDEDIYSLCQKYRVSLADHLYRVASGDGDIQIALEYSKIIDGTEFLGSAERFVIFCDVLVKKAESEMQVCAIFKGIVAKEEYPSFSDKYKNALRECRDMYLRRIKDMPLDRTAPDAELGIIKRSAELEMLRVYAEGLITSLALSDDSEAVDAIIFSAVAGLRFADSTEELEAAVACAELEVYRQRAKEALASLKMRTDGALDLLIYINSEKRSEYRDGLSAMLSGANSALDTTQELSSAMEIFREYEAQIASLYESARADDLSAAKLWASARVDEQSRCVISEVENMRYTAADERSRFIDEVQSASALVLQNIQLCASAGEVEALISLYGADVSALLAEAERCELVSAKEFSLSAAGGRAEELLEMLDGLTYISNTLLENIKSDISDDLSELAQSFEGAKSVAVVESTLDQFITALAETERAAIAEDLDSAIAELSRSLRNMRADAESRIGEMRYLSADALVEYSARASELCDAAISGLSEAEGVSAAEGIWQSANEDYGELMVSLERDELSAARGQAKDELALAIDASRDRIDALEYLGETAKNEFLLQLEDLISEFSSLLQGEATPVAVEGRLAEYRQKIRGIEASAKQENVVEARAHYTAALDAAFSAYKPTDYTSHRYALIKGAYDKALLDITMASDAESIAKLFFAAEQSMEAVVSIFEDRQAELLQSVNAAYVELMKMSAQYSSANLEAIAEIKQRALDDLIGAESSMGLSSLSEIADSAISAMRAIKLDWISAGKLSADSSGFGEYPAGYDYAVGGVWGVVENAGGLPSDVRLSISLSESNKLYKKALREALSESRIAYVGDVPMSDAEIRECLDGLEIKGIFSIKLIRSAAVYDEFSGEYTVRILLPSYMRSERTLRVVYISPDGDAEYYDAVCEDGMLVFKTTHFSDFLVLGERRVNLLPIIALLAVIGVLEGLALIATKAWIAREMRVLCVLYPMPFAALRVIAPRGGIAMLIALLLIDVTLGVLIFIDLRELGKMRRGAQTARVYALPTDFEDNEDDMPPLDAAEEAPVAALPAYLERVSAEDADSLISDGKASTLIIRSEFAPKVCRGCKKTFINVDTISENFARGETVSLKTLKERGLVPMSACYIKVLARGVIDKPLTVRAQSFSANAVKMITLTGGSAILEGSDVE